MREVKAAQSLLSAGNIKRILRTSNGVPAGERREDFAGVVQRLAERVRRSAADSVEIAEADLSLQAVIAGERCVFAIANVGKVAIGALAGESGCARSRARSDAGGNKRTKTVGD